MSPEVLKWALAQGGFIVVAAAAVAWGYYESKARERERKEHSEALKAAQEEVRKAYAEMVKHNDETVQLQAANRKTIEKMRKMLHSLRRRKLGGLK